eukprot:TRINITY_DN2625_c1_g5_i1.p1 TRINITY_DN2625_c1_g5~~TRINITY_DN2625_c1_g5_i1.p1  ORF type:complete len:350 (+),score=87.40 TRINITY_DN2625_c1_g5_i1:33-1052(+)
MGRNLQMENTPDEEITVTDFVKTTKVEQILNQEYLATDSGQILITTMGNPNGFPMIAYHDIGLNHRTCFGGFFNYPEWKTLEHNFLIYCIDAPGQEDNAVAMDWNYEYPSFQQLVEQIDRVVDFYGISSFVGFGVGLGGTLLMNYAKRSKDTSLVRGLIIANSTARKLGWLDAGYYKLVTNSLYWGNIIGDYVVKQFLNRYFGAEVQLNNPDLVALFRREIENIPPPNLYKILYAYLQRDELTPEDLQSINTEMLLFIGTESFYEDEMFYINEHCDNTRTTYLLFRGTGGLITEESPEKLTEPIRLWLLGNNIGAKTTIYPSSSSEPDTSEEEEEEKVI